MTMRMDNAGSAVAAGLVPGALSDKQGESSLEGDHKGV